MPSRKEVLAQKWLQKSEEEKDQTRTGIQQCQAQGQVFRP